MSRMRMPTTTKKTRDMVFSSIFGCFVGSAVWISRLASMATPRRQRLEGVRLGPGVGYRYVQEAEKFALLPVSDGGGGNVSPFLRRCLYETPGDQSARGTLWANLNT